MGIKAFICILALVAFSTIVDSSQNHVKNTGSTGFVVGPDILDADTEPVILPSSVQRVLDIVNNVESMPSCAKIATSNLMHSCSTLEGSFLNEDADMNRGSDLFIADEMGLYAARLAVCELNEADSLIPTGCEAFIPTQRTKKQSGFRGFWTGSGPTQPNPSYAAYDDLTQAQSKHCISALYTIPQAWMSFSNSKQNAVTMCRAMRSEIDKEEQLHIAKILSESAVAASGSLHDAFEQANGLIAQFVELRSLMRNFHINVADGNQKELERVEYIWGYLNRIQEAASEVESTIDHLRDDARAAHIDVADLRSEIQSTGATAAVVLNEVVAEATTGTDLTVKNFNKIHEMAEVVKTVEQENLKSIMDLSYHISAASATAESIAGSFLTLRDAHDRNLETMLQKEKDLNELLEKNRGVIGQTTEALEELDSTARSLLSGLGIEWASARELLHKTSTFAVHVAVYTLLGFGVWEKLIRASLMGTIFAALGTAITLVWVQVTPLSAYEFMSEMVSGSSDDNHSILWMCLGLMACAFIYCAMITVKSIAGHAIPTKDRQFVEYDPASPCLPPAPKWAV